MGTNDDDDEGGAGSGPQHLAENMLNDIMERIEDVNFDVAEVVSMLNEEKTPFQNVFLQEIKQMAELVVEMVASLKELALGFAGELTISDAMDALMMSLFYGTVPTKWTKLAWPSLRSLTAWMRWKCSRSTTEAKKPSSAEPDRDPDGDLALGSHEPAVLPHRHHATIGAAERLGVGQIVHPDRRYQEESGGD